MFENNNNNNRCIKLDVIVEIGPMPPAAMAIFMDFCFNQVI
jgi:hypothetical protein